MKEKTMELAQHSVVSLELARTDERWRVRIYIDRARESFDEFTLIGWAVVVASEPDYDSGQVTTEIQPAFYADGRVRTYGEYEAIESPIYGWEMVK